MVKHLKKLDNPQEEIHYYYDDHFEEGEEELMGAGVLHALLIDYLTSVLRWLFLGKNTAVYSELTFYGTTFEMESPLCPDIAVLKGVQVEEEDEAEILSWSVPLRGLAPQVVFEIASPKTWEKDVEIKPSLYALLGVQEYFFYAPKPSLLGRQFVSPQLLGWRRNAVSGLLESMSPDERGRLWSSELESQLVPDGTKLRLYDADGQMRLTGQEAEQQAKEAERRRAEIAEQRAEALAQQLRALGHGPNKL